MNPHRELISVTIEQQWASGVNRLVSVKEECGQNEESQEAIGRAIGEALRGMLAQQNCGCHQLLWLGLFNELAYDESGGEWLRQLHKAVVQWFAKSGERDIDFNAWMLKEMRKSPLPPG